MAQQIIMQSLKLMLQPLARFCIRHSVKMQDVTELFKNVLVQAASDEISGQDEAISASRLSVVTGVHRKDVTRIMKGATPERPYTNLTGRVLGQWQHDKRFTTKSNNPRTLSAEGKDSEFAQLVRSVSGDLNPYTVLFELERMQAVERTNMGVKLRSRVYLPEKDFKYSYNLLAKDTRDLIAAVDENIITENGLPNLHLRTEYDNIRATDLPAIRRWLLEEGDKFHQSVSAFLSKFDEDVNPKGEPAAVRVAVGSYSRIDLFKTNKGLTDEN